MRLMNLRTFAVLFSATLPLTACVAEDELGDDAPIEDEDLDYSEDTSELSSGWPGAGMVVGVWISRGMAELLVEMRESLGAMFDPPRFGA